VPWQNLIALRFSRSRAEYEAGKRAVSFQATGSLLAGFDSSGIKYYEEGNTKQE
jgi:hypothetical protein